MFVRPHIEESEKGDNLGSCGKYANYLSKEAAYFFNHSSENISLNEAIRLIDEHSKGQLKKDEAKWYAPVYALSEKEAQFICYKLFGKIYSDYDDLTAEERVIYNNYIVELGKSFQDEMAKNFNKSDVGITDGSTLCYVGVVENSRMYKEYDEEVKAGRVKAGTSKTGFNTHIHIIQSRKANNVKKSKISPMQKSKKESINNMGVKVGFDRNAFKVAIENKFDILTGYKRKEEETFTYVNEVRKESKRQRVIYRNEKKYYTKEEAELLKAKSDVVGYFFHLVQLDKLEYIEKDSKGREVFRDRKSKEIYLVNSTYYYNQSSKKGGDIFKANAEFESINYLYALRQMERQKGYVYYTNYAAGFSKRETEEIIRLKEDINGLFRKRQFS